MAADTIEPSDSAPSPSAANPRRQRILEAARRCFAGDGFASATIIDVAKAAGVSRPLVYKYFGDKDGLIDAVLQSTFDEWAALHARLSTPSDLTAAEALARKFEASIEFVQTRPVFRSILLHDAEVVVRGHLADLRRSRSVSFEATRTIVVAGVAAGEFRRDLDPDAIAASLELLLFSLLQRALGLQPELALDRALVDTTLALTLDGLRAS